MNEIILKEKMLEMLLNACPNISDKWKEHLDYWNGEPAGDYNDVSVIAHYLVDEYENQNIEFFPNFFCVVEQLLTEGSDEIKQIITIGLIEDIQTISSHSFGFKVFERYLRPETSNAWKYIIAIWQDKSSLMDVVRSERNQSK